MQDFYTPNSKLCQFPLKSKSITKFLEQFQFRPTILGFEQGMFRRNRSQPRTRGCYEVWTEPRIIRNEQLLEERWEHSSLAGYDGDEAGAVDAGGDLLHGGTRQCGAYWGGGAPPGSRRRPPPRRSPPASTARASSPSSPVSLNCTLIDLSLVSTLQQQV